MKRVRRLRQDESGVASTVGTIMALLVFLTFMSMIVNQYVPVWMKDAEASHMSGAFGQFGTFKGSVDLQMLAALMAQMSGVHYIPITTFSPVTLGLDGIPIFAGPTTGDLISYPLSSPWTTQLTYKIRGVSTKLNESSSGRIELDVWNKYYIRQTVAYENGAVVRSQSDGQAIRAEPTFAAEVVNNTVRISWVQISLFGAGSASGTATEGIHSKLLGVDRQEYTSVSSDVYINATTPYGVAWIASFNATLGDAFGVSREAFKTCPPNCFSQSYVGGQIQTLSITTEYYKLSAEWKSAKSAFDIIVQIYNYGVHPSPAKPIGVVWIQHAFVNVAIAERGTEVTI